MKDFIEDGIPKTDQWPTTFYMIQLVNLDELKIKELVTGNFFVKAKLVSRVACHPIMTHIDDDLQTIQQIYRC